MRDNKFFILVVLVCLFLAFRLAVLFGSLDKLYEPEELYRGTIAHEIINGALIPITEYLDYKVEYFPGGTLVVGIMAVPFFLIFGHTYIALKLVGLLFSLGTFILWYLFLFNFLSKRAAIISALLLIFCPPFYTKTSLITWGAHPEANLFTIAAIFIFYLIFFQDGKNGITDIYQAKKKYFFMLGILSGFALWFVQTFLVTFIFIFLFWFIFDKRIFLRRVFYILSLGFLIGSIPAIFYVFLNGGKVFLISGKIPFLDIMFVDLNKILDKILFLFLYDLPRSFLFPEVLMIRAEVFSYLYYFLFIISLFFLLWKNRKDILIYFKSFIYPITLKETKVFPALISRESFIVVFPIWFVFCYCFSSYSVNHEPWPNAQDWLDYIDYRYMIPVMPFVMVTIGIFLAKVWNKKIIFYVFFQMVLILGFIGNAKMIFPGNFAKYLSDKGYSYNIIGDKIGLRVTQNLNEYILPFHKLENNLRAQFYDGLGAGIAWRMRDENAQKIVDLFKSEVNEEYQRYLYRGWGTLFSVKYIEEFQDALNILSIIPLSQKEFFYEGLSRDMGFFNDNTSPIESMKMSLDFINKIDRTYWPACYLGLGYGAGFRFKNERDMQKKLNSMVEAHYQEVFLRGIYLGELER